MDKYNAANGDSQERRGPVVKRLDQTIQVSAQRNMSSTLAVATGGVDLEAANVRKVESKVDKKKLEKAERKIAGVWLQGIESRNVIGSCRTAQGCLVFISLSCHHWSALE